MFVVVYDKEVTDKDVSEKKKLLIFYPKKIYMIFNKIISGDFLA